MKISKAKKETKRQQKLAAMILIFFFQNTGYQTGKPGMKEIYWAPSSDITVQPEPSETQTTPGATRTATGAWTATNGFIKLNNDLFKGSELKVKSAGDITSPTIETEVNGDVIGLTPEILERHTGMLGVPGVLVIKDNTCPSDTYWVVGCSCDPTLFMFDFTSDRVGGTNGKKTALVFQSKCTPYLWTQGINTLPLSTLDEVV